MSMGIIELVGRGLGCESCGIVSTSGPTHVNKSMFRSYAVALNSKVVFGDTSLTFSHRSKGLDLRSNISRLATGSCAALTDLLPRLGP